jgi:hypothetical protein
MNTHRTESTARAHFLVRLEIHSISPFLEKESKTKTPAYRPVFLQFA